MLAGNSGHFKKCCLLFRALYSGINKSQNETLNVRNGIKFSGFRRYSNPLIISHSAVLHKLYFNLYILIYMIFFFFFRSDLFVKNLNCKLLKTNSLNNSDQSHNFEECFIFFSLFGTATRTAQHSGTSFLPSCMLVAPSCSGLLSAGGTGKSIVIEGSMAEA